MLLSAGTSSTTAETSAGVEGLSANIRGGETESEGAGDGGYPWPMEAVVRQRLAACRVHAQRVRPADLRTLQRLSAERPVSCGWLLEGVAVLVGATSWRDASLLRRALEISASPQAALGLAAVPARKAQQIRWAALEGGRAALTASEQHREAERLSFESLRQSCGSVAHLRPWLEEMLGEPDSIHHHPSVGR
eukprot:SAG22_NODE_4729_length_1180_cov_1.280296_2_plen_192_part_00